MFCLFAVQKSKLWHNLFFYHLFQDDFHFYLKIMTWISFPYFIENYINLFFFLPGNTFFSPFQTKQQIYFLNLFPNECFFPLMTKETSSRYHEAKWVRGMTYNVLTAAFVSIIFTFCDISDLLVLKLISWVRYVPTRCSALPKQVKYKSMLMEILRSFLHASDEFGKIG